VGGMNIQRDFLVSVTLAAAATTAALVTMPASAQTMATEPVKSTASIPDFSGVWRHPSLPGLEPLASGPTSLTNLVRRRGVSNYDQLVGDHNNPILQPWAAEVVRQHGEISKTGVMFPSPANQCWPEPLPYIYKNFAMMMLQTPDKITFIYSEDHEVRWVRMNVPHQQNVEPTWHGDSVGHYEGDTLVIDTIATKTDRPFLMLDLFGTPFSDKLHVVERYRLINFEEAKDGLDRDARENQLVQRETMDRNASGKYLQVQFTVEDPNVFTTSWSATVTYGRSLIDWLEVVCPENRMEYFHGENSGESKVPRADTPDF
jgi:hypothetical protein